MTSRFVCVEGIIAREGEIASIEVSIDARVRHFSAGIRFVSARQAVLTPARNASSARLPSVCRHAESDPHRGTHRRCADRDRRVRRTAVHRACDARRPVPIEDAGMPPVRLSAAGWAARPRLANDSAAHRRNRRIDIVVLGTVTAAMVEPVVGAMR
jgi:hypothetical protein